MSQAGLLETAGLVGVETARLEEALRNSNSPQTAEEVTRQLEYLAIALRNAVNIFDPDVIVLDGFLGVLHALSNGGLESRLRTQALDGPAEHVGIYRAGLGSDLMMIGAAELAFSGFLADPASVGRLPVPVRGN